MCLKYPLPGLPNGRGRLPLRQCLLPRAPPGGAAADRPVPHLGTAPRAAAAGVPGRDDVAGVHPAPGDGGFQGGLERTVEAVRVRGPQRIRPGRRMHPGLPEDLVGQQVPHARDPGLVEEPGLDRDRTPGDQAAELRRGDLGGVRPERVDGRVEPDPPEPALVEQDEAAAVGKAEREPVPFGLVGLRVAPARPAALGRAAAAEVTRIRPPMPR